MENIKEINPFKEQNIELLEQTPADNNRFGSTNLSGVKELQVGWGSEVFRSDESGIWLGKKTFAEASHPTTGTFAVDMQGNLTATSITLSGYLQVGQALGDVQSSTSTLSGISSNLGTITAGTITGININGSVITGGTIRTSSGSTRVEIDGGDNALYYYDSGNIRLGLTDGGLFFNTPSGISSSSIQGFGTNDMMITIAGSLLSYHLNTSYFYADSPVDIGSSFYPFNSLYCYGISLNGDYRTSWSESPFSGSVLSGGGGTLPSGWSASNIATGRYQVTHNLGTTAYSVVATPVVSVAKVWAIESKGTNSFIVRIANTSFSLENNPFDFILLKN
jgi:hypothetical protein